MLSWWELPEEDQPPPEIWGMDDELAIWWEEVELRRKEKYGTDRGGDEPMTKVDMTDNEYAKSLLAGVK